MTFKLAMLARLTLAVIFVFGENQAASVNLTETTAKRFTRENLYDAYYDPFGLETSEDHSTLPYYYRASPRIGELEVDGRNFRNLLNNYRFIEGKVYSDENQPQGRLNVGGAINSLLFNNRFANAPSRPLAGLFPNTAFPVTLNPNFPNLLTTFDSCTSPSGEAGVCAPGKVCSVFGGRPSGSCVFGGVCCISAITTCGGTVTLNNTYWQSPVTQVSAPSSCSLTVKTDSRFLEQKKPICQIRLDFISFSLSQPNAETVCATDTFQVVGARNNVPTICGDNAGQHMYLNVPPSDITPSSLQLIFSFGATTFTRSWNIKIALLPCGASYLAPNDCLQYFTTASGTVRSFNWADTAATATRQLANQDYNICFRNELINNQRTKSICYSVCTTINANRGFLVSAANTAANGAAGTIVAGQSQNLADNCNNDFLVIAGGYDPAVAAGPANALDRYCGERLNTAVSQAASAQVCTTARPFSIIYRTNGDETTTASVDGAVGANIDGNLGFCLTFTQKT